VSLYQRISGIASAETEKIESGPLQSTGRKFNSDFFFFLDNDIVTVFAKVAAILRFS
jgi:hypothetical protein